MYVNLNGGNAKRKGVWCVCVCVRWSGGESCTEILMHRVTPCLLLKHTHTQRHTSGTYPSLYVHLNRTRCLPHRLFLFLSLQPSLFYLCVASPLCSRPRSSSSLLQMGWVESWLRTFMPKTTCHPSLLLSRMVML